MLAAAATVHPGKGQGCGLCCSACLVTGACCRLDTAGAGCLMVPKVAGPGRSGSLQTWQGALVCARRSGCSSSAGWPVVSWLVSPQHFSFLPQRMDLTFRLTLQFSSLWLGGSSWSLLQARNFFGGRPATPHSQWVPPPLLLQYSITLTGARC
ncbi:hypothetical protein NDU88_000647 [Pleurodeles waltl]|uniref:Uncharacterized protein n=1 Tax=Pleurodeles waltl TaxID=8319 RepID=A0AAV7V698_PLEWA|nr:hypothetical protein NDU88_000647 [Pleurodeles waltl]